MRVLILYPNQCINYFNVNKMKKLIYFFAFLFLSSNAISQTQKSATVLNVISLGLQNYCILVDDETNIYYKSSPYIKDELTEQQEILISIDNVDANQVEIISPTFNDRLFAYKINNTNDESFFPTEDKLPVLVDDILFFSSEEHVREFCDLMSFYIDHSSQDETLDDKINLLESKFVNFTSFRNYLFTDYENSGNGITEIEIETLEHKDFMNDEIHKAIFNKYRLLGVGDSVYYYHSRDITIKFQKNDTLVMSIIKDVSQIDFNDPIDLFSGDYLDPIERKHERFVVVSNQIFWPAGDAEDKGITIVNNSLGYQTIPYYRNKDCDAFTKYIRVNEVYEVTFPNTPTDTNSYTAYDLSNNNATLTIDWGDGSPVQVINNYNGEEIEHIYPTGISAYYEPTTTLTFLNSLGTYTSVSDGVNVPGGVVILFDTYSTCTNGDKEQWGVLQSGNWKMTTKIWTQHNWLGHKFGAYTHAWKHTGGSWKRRWAKISVSVNGTYRNSTCVITETKSGSKTHNNDRKIQKTKNKLFAHYSMSDGDVFSTHRLVKGGINLYLEMTLNPCQ